jgi:transposase, IS5 family
VLDGEQVPASDKICSIFEPHTDLIKRGEVRAKVFLAESARELITQYECPRAIRRTNFMWRRRSSVTSPALYGADRGFFSENNVAVCVRGGAATVSIPSAVAARRRDASVSRPRRRVRTRTMSHSKVLSVG